MKTLEAGLIPKDRVRKRKAPTNRLANKSSGHDSTDG